MLRDKPLLTREAAGGLSRKKSLLIESEIKFLVEVSRDVGDGNTDLLHGIAVTDGDTTVIGGLKIHGDAIRRADLIFAAIPFADGTGFIIVYVEILRQHFINFSWPKASSTYKSSLLVIVITTSQMELLIIYSPKI